MPKSKSAPEVALFRWTRSTAVVGVPLRWLLAPLAALLVAGCPQGFTDPSPTQAGACESVDDCNDGRVCGELRLCVDGACEAEPSLVRVCDDDGGQSDGGDASADDGGDAGS